MRSPAVAVIALLALTAGVTACAPGSPGDRAPDQTPTVERSTAASPVDDTPPPDAVPARVGSCPYLQTGWIEDANGEHVAKVATSADKPYPACFFYRPDGGVDVTIQVFTGTAQAANALIDRVAPVATSDKASEPAGWTGGLESFGKAKGAVYAVRKEGTGIAVVVKTNQAQTVKAKRIAVQAIQALHL